MLAVWEHYANSEALIFSKLGIYEKFTSFVQPPNEACFGKS